VLARVPRKMQTAFMGRKHTTTQNVLAAIDFNLRFTYVLAGLEDSAHDALILSDALARPNVLTIPPGTTHYPSDVNLLDSRAYYL
jgi:hypothetical protein